MSKTYSNLEQFVDIAASSMRTLNDLAPMTAEKKEKVLKGLSSLRRAVQRLPLRRGEKEAAIRQVKFCQRNVLKSPAMVAREVRRCTLRLAKTIRTRSSTQTVVPTSVIKKPAMQPKKKAVEQKSAAAAKQVGEITVVQNDIIERDLIGLIERNRKRLNVSCNQKQRGKFLAMQQALIEAAIVGADKDVLKLSYERTQAGSINLIVKVTDEKSTLLHRIAVDRLGSMAWSTVHGLIGMPPRRSRKRLTNQPQRAGVRPSVAKPKRRCRRTSTCALNARRALVKSNPYCEQCGAEVVELRNLNRRSDIKLQDDPRDEWAKWTESNGKVREALVASIHHRISRHEWAMRGLKGSPDRKSNLAVLCIPCHRNEHQPVVSQPQLEGVPSAIKAE